MMSAYVHKKEEPVSNAYIRINPGGGSCDKTSWGGVDVTSLRISDRGLGL